MGFLKAFFTGKQETPESEKQKNEQKNFEILKYDGIRAQRIGRMDYAVKCFTEALKLQEDFETMLHLANVHIRMGALEEGRNVLERMTQLEPTHVSTFLALANVCYMEEDYEAMANAAREAVRLEEANAEAHYLLGKATHGQGDVIMSIAHLTKAVVLKDDFVEARLLRAEILFKMNQGKEAAEDVSAVLAVAPEEETALLLHGRLQEADEAFEAAEADYLRIIELNPFNEQAVLALGNLYIALKKPAEAIALLDEAIEMSPDFAQAYHERGRAKLLNGDKDGATEDMKRVLEINPQDAKAFTGEYNNQPRQTDILGL